MCGKVDKQCHFIHLIILLTKTQDDPRTVHCMIIISHFFVAQKKKTTAVRRQMETNEKNGTTTMTTTTKNKHKRNSLHVKINIKKFY